MRQAAFRFVVGVIVVAFALGCDTSDPAAARVKLDERMAPARTLEQTFQRIHAQLRVLEPMPCPDLTIRSAIAQSQSRKVPFIDAAALALAAKGAPVDPKLPLARFVSKVLVDRRASASTGRSRRRSRSPATSGSSAARISAGTWPSAVW
jgi:hypothetical protein